VKNFIEIHALQNFAPSNLNRDDTGAPKDAIFGGTRRTRISSQCLKRAVRRHFADRIGTSGLETGDLASRTKRFLEPLVELLTGMGRPREEAEAKVKAALATVELSLKEDGKTQYLLFLGQREIEGVARVIDAHWDAIQEAQEATEDKKAGKAKKQAAKSADPAFRKAMEKVFDGGKAVDVALFGRMLADMPAKNQEAACQVAHAISTHATEREFDYYTAVDDLKPEDTAGADMIGTVEFSSACFYRYAMVSWDQLVANLQGDKALAEKGLRVFLEGFVLAEPTGKQNTFAAHNPPEFVAVSVRKDGAPRNLANAFEAAVRVRRGESLTQISVTRLTEKAKSLQAAYGGDHCTTFLDLTGGAPAEFGQAVPTLEALIESAMATLKE